MISEMYCAIPEEWKGKDVVKFGRSINVKNRFRDYGDLEIIKVCNVKDLIRAERELHELARINFGKAGFIKEHYSCDDIGWAIEVIDEIYEKFRL
jgi:hypothetical protein